jgi:hypothetical protein
MKLSYEKLQNESLEIKFKLVDQDNQNLRKTLLSNSRKYNNTEKYTFLLSLLSFFEAKI